MAWIGSFAMATMLGVVVISAVAAWIANRGPRRPPAEPTGNLSEQLSGVEAESTEDALRRLSLEDLPASPVQPSSENERSGA